MKIRVLFVPAVLVSLLLVGCRTTSVGYKCIATITPVEQEDTYEAQIELTEIRGQSETVICSPKLICAPGQSAKIMVSEDEHEQSGFFATVFIPEPDTGGTALCSVHLKENGQTKFLSDFRLTLPTKPPPAAE